MDHHNRLAPCQCRPALQRGRWGLRTCKLTHSTPKLNQNMPWSTLTWKLDKGSNLRKQPRCHSRCSKAHPHDKQKNCLDRRWEAGRLGLLCELLHVVFEGMVALLFVTVSRPDQEGLRSRAKRRRMFRLGDVDVEGGVACSHPLIRSLAHHAQAS